MKPPPGMLLLNRSRVLQSLRNNMRSLWGLRCSECRRSVNQASQAANRHQNWSIPKRQHHRERGFFVSNHPIQHSLSAWLSSMRCPEAKPFNAANLAYPFGCGARVGGGANILLIIGLLSAMAIPAFQKVRDSRLRPHEQSHARTCLRAIQPGQWARPDIIRSVNRYITQDPICMIGGDYGIDLDENGLVGTCTTHGTVEFTAAPAQATN